MSSAAAFLALFFSDQSLVLKMNKASMLGKNIE